MNRTNTYRQRFSPVTKRKHIHDDTIKWKHFPRYWPFMRGIHRPPVNSPHKDQWRRALMFSLIWDWTYGWVNNRDAGDLRRHCAHYGVIVMQLSTQTVSRDFARKHPHGDDKDRTTLIMCNNCLIKKFHWLYDDHVCKYNFKTHSTEEQLGYSLLICSQINVTEPH